MAKRKTNAGRPAAAKPAAAAEPAAPVTTNGMSVELATVTAPSTKISLELGIENLVAVGVVRAEKQLNSRLEEQVEAAHHFGKEIADKNSALQQIYDTESIDIDFKHACEDLIAAAEKLGLRLSLALTKGGFSPESLTYSVGARFSGDMATSRVYTIDNERATELLEEIKILRDQQTVQTKAARRTKDMLNVSWLERTMRAGIAENAMQQTESGEETLAAWLDYIDRAIDTAPQPQRQLAKS